MGRSSKGTVTISHPAPSIALAGTPATFDGVISGTGDGLFSRFLFYRFEREFEWSTQFGESSTGLEQSLQSAAEEFQVGYHQLKAREEPLRVHVPEALQRAHDRTFHSLTEKWRNDEAVSRSLQASLTRAGLQAVKIAVVLRGIRLAESGVPPAPSEPAELGAEDMEAGLRLALTYLLHAIRVETRFREETSPRRASPSGSGSTWRRSLTRRSRRRRRRALPHSSAQASATRSGGSRPGGRPACSQNRSAGRGPSSPPNWRGSPAWEVSFLSLTTFPPSPASRQHSTGNTQRATLSGQYSMGDIQ